MSILYPEMELEIVPVEPEYDYEDVNQDVIATILDVEQFIQEMEECN